MCLLTEGKVHMGTPAAMAVEVVASVREDITAVAGELASAVAVQGAQWISGQLGQKVADLAQKVAQKGISGLWHEITDTYNRGVAVNTKRRSGR